MAGRREAAKACGRAGDAEPADGQRRQGDQQQHFADALDEAPGAAAGLAAVDGAPAALGEALAEGLGGGARIGAFGEQQAVGGGVEAAGLDQAGGGEAGFVDQGRRRQREAGHGAAWTR